MTRRPGRSQLGGRLSDLRKWHIITATCFKCGYQGTLTAGFLAWDRPLHTYLTDFKPKL